MTMVLKSTVPADVERAWLIRVESLSLSYSGKTALHDVSLEIPEQEITALIGPSGCGKSSFLASLNRLSDLLPGCRVRGSVQLGRTEVLHPSTNVNELRRRIGMIFQKPNPFPLSIRRNIELPLLERGVRARGALDEVVERVLRRVGLWDEVHDRLDRSALALSGGQQQRLCIARALALEPEVILLDEPCSALDPISSATVEDLILQLRESCTIVIVTHNLAQARRISDHLAVFWVQDGMGRIIESGPTASVFSAPRHELTRAYISGHRG